jgi:hypothetical protein
MKACIKLIAGAFIIFFYSFCNAQVINTPAQWLAFQQRQLKGCAYIIEGTITQQKSYNGKTGRMMCSVIQITKIFRGSPQIKLGSIKIITNQYSKNVADASPNIGKGHYIIFGTPTKSSLPIDTIFTTDNLLILQASASDWVTFTGSGAQWGWRKVTYYKTLDSLYSFFKENGLTVQEEVEQKN